MCNRRYWPTVPTQCGLLEFQRAIMSEYAQTPNTRHQIRQINMADTCYRPAACVFGWRGRKLGVYVDTPQLWMHTNILYTHIYMYVYVRIRVERNSALERSHKYIHTLERRRRTHTRTNSPHSHHKTYVSIVRTHHSHAHAAHYAYSHLFAHTAPFRPNARVRIDRTIFTPCMRTVGACACEVVRCLGCES